MANRVLKVNMNRLRELAKMNGVNFLELNTKAQLTNGAIQKWEKAEPRITSLYNVAQTLETSMEYLLDLEITDDDGNKTVIPLEEVKKNPAKKISAVFKYCSMCGRKL